LLIGIRESYVKIYSLKRDCLIRGYIGFLRHQKKFQQAIIRKILIQAIHETRAEGIPDMHWPLTAKNVSIIVIVANIRRIAA
jgi:hypothetical protein